MGMDVKLEKYDNDLRLLVIPSLLSRQSPESICTKSW